MVAGSIPTVVRLTFQPARCGYTLRVTSKTLYSPEYITSKHTQKYAFKLLKIREIGCTKLLTSSETRATIKITLGRDWESVSR